MRIRGILVALLLCAVPIEALVWNGIGPEGFSVKINIPDGKVTIPERLDVVLELSYPVGYEVDLQTIRANLLRNGGPGENPFLLVSQKKEAQPEGINGANVRFTLEPLLPGSQVITPMNIPFLSKTGQEPKKVEIIADIFPIEIELPKLREFFEFNNISAPLIGLGEILPIELDFDRIVRLKDNPEKLKEEAKYNASLLKSKQLPWNAVGAAIGILLMWTLIKNAPRKKRDSGQQIKESEMFYQNALQKLQKLEQNGDVDPVLVDEYFVQLSNSVRYRIEEQFNLKAPYLTSQEFIRTLESHPILSDNTRALLHDFLESTDRVKFALHRPSLEECRVAEQTARNFLQNA